jgi:CheY-like chemotaxis protein
VTKVLYVEHNDDNLYMLKTRLELRGGFEVLAAEDSEKGCRLAATEHPDVILMDLEMPDDDRWEAVRPPKPRWLAPFNGARRRLAEKSTQPACCRSGKAAFRLSL